MASARFAGVSSTTRIVAIIAGQGASRRRSSSARSRLSLPTGLRDVTIREIWHVGRVNDRDHDHRYPAGHWVGFELAEDVAAVTSGHEDVEQDRGW